MGNRCISFDAAPGRRGWISVALALGWCATGASAIAAGEDDYLKMLEAEAAKLGPPVATVPDAGVGGAGSESDLGMFEEELRRHYSGTFAFYQKLPRRTQEEIFQEYSQGASIEDIRDKIYDRYLHN